METINIIKERGHILLPIGNKRAVLDTGSPQSMAPEPFEFLGVRRNVPTNIGGVTPQIMSEVAGFPIDIIIGCDILSKHTVRLRWRDGYMDIGEDIPDGDVPSPMETFKNLPVFPLSLQGNRTKAFFDTGAHLSYIDPERVAGMPPSGQRDDFSPYIGQFTTDIYTVPTSLDHTPLDIEYGIMPDTLKQMFGWVFAATNASAVIGTQMLEHFDCTISWPRNTISWTRIPQ